MLIYDAEQNVGSLKLGYRFRRAHWSDYIAACDHILVVRRTICMEKRNAISDFASSQIVGDSWYWFDWYSSPSSVESRHVISPRSMLSLKQDQHLFHWKILACSWKINSAYSYSSMSHWLFDTIKSHRAVPSSTTSWRCFKGQSHWSFFSWHSFTLSPFGG